MTGQRRLSQAISEGDGISLIAPIADADDGRAAEADGAEALLVLGDVWGIREATTLPVLSLDPAAGDADACVLTLDGLDEEEIRSRHADLLERGFESVVQVHDDETLERALEHADPEIFFLVPAPEDQSPEAAAERVLGLLPDVPAGKLAIAHLMVTTREQVAALERAGFDAVTVGTPDVAGLAGAAPPEV